MKRFVQIAIPILLLLIFNVFADKAGLTDLRKLPGLTGFVDLRKFPEASGPKTVVLNCTYHDQKIQISETLYQSIDEYYSKDPKKAQLDYALFTQSDPKDQTVKNLTQKIKTKGTELGLTEDQTMDLATCFVQNIPYDSEKAKTVLSQNPGDKVTQKDYYDRFPYETLYDNQGICTDKSYLEAAILKEMGYGTAILTFDAERHMAVGVDTPTGYTSFNTEYSYIETTNSGYKVGQLPAIDENVGGAKKAELDKSQADQGFIPDLPKSDFTPPSEVIKIADGKEYKRIIEITNEINRLKSLTAEINAKNQALSAQKNELKNMENQLQAAKGELSQAEARLEVAKSAYKADPTTAKYTEYQRAYNEYQSVRVRTNSEIDRYNAAVNRYNGLITELKSLIEEYNRLIKSD